MEKADSFRAAVYRWRRRAVKVVAKYVTAAMHKTKDRTSVIMIQTRSRRMSCGFLAGSSFCDLIK